MTDKEELDALKARAKASVREAKLKQRAITRRLYGLPPEKALPTRTRAETGRISERPNRLSRTDTATRKEIQELAGMVGALRGRGAPRHGRSSFFISKSGEKFKLRWDDFKRKWKELEQ